MCGSASGILVSLRSPSKRTTFFVMAAAACLLPAGARGFDMKTHLWIAQQVLDDVLDDGCITIEGVAEPLEVPPDLVQILRSNRGAFFAGNLGPDAFPDLVGGQMTTHPGIPDGWQTDDWLTWLLERADEPRREAFARGYVAHAAADIFAHTYANLYAGDIFALQDASVDLMEPELRHLAVEKYISTRLPPFSPSGLLVDSAWLRDVLILAPEVADQYAKVAATGYLARMQRLVERIDEALAFVDEFEREMQEKIASIQAKIDSLKDLEFRICTPRVCAFGHCIPRKCWNVRLWPYYCLLDPASCVLIEALELFLLPAMSDLATAPFRAPLVAWRDQVLLAMDRYIEMSRQVAASIAGVRGYDARSAIADWICTYLPSFLPIPNHTLVLPGFFVDEFGPCDAPLKSIQALSELYDAIGKAENWIADKLDDLGWFGDVLGWSVFLPVTLDLLVREITETLAAEFTDLAQDIVGPDHALYDMLAMLQPAENPAQAAARLRDLFAGTSGGKRLLVIPDIVERIDADMHRSGSETLDGRTFLPLRNAVVLAKLSLLNPSELNRMVRLAGVGETIYGSSLYAATPAFSVLKRAVRSIDGNHQWQEYGLPYPRQLCSGCADTATHHYGYRYTPTTGFRLWQDCEVRSKVFLAIFKGPLAPAMENAESLGFANLLAPGDPNRATDANPFPDLQAASALPRPMLGRVQMKRPESPTDYLSAIVKLRSSRPGAACPGGGAGLSYRWKFQEDVEVLATLDFASETEQGYTCGDNPEFGAGALVVERASRVVRRGSTRIGTLVKRDRTDPSSYVLRVAVDRRGTQTKYGLAWNNNLLCDPTASITHLIKTRGNDDNELRVGCDISDKEGVLFTTEILIVGGLNLHGGDVNWDAVNATVKREFPRATDLCDAVEVPAAVVMEEELESEPPQDEWAPWLQGPKTIVVEARSPFAQAVSLPRPRLLDDEDAEPQLTSDAPPAFPRGITTVRWTATDASGNVSTISQDVIVVDTTPPVFTGALPPIVVTASGETTRVELPVPTATDAAGTVTVVMRPLRTVFPIGESTVRWLATDEAGNTAEAKQVVRVVRLEGDVDLDGDVDMDDVWGVTVSLNEPLIASPPSLRDFDGNGTIDDSDRAVFARIQERSGDPRDLDGDWRITSADVAATVQRCNGCSMPDSPFRRGEVNGDGTVDLSDAISILNFLFVGGKEPTCQKSADVDDSGALDVSDGIRLLGYLYLGGAEPRPPFGACGRDPNPDGISCLFTVICP